MQNLDFRCRRVNFINNDIRCKNVLIDIWSQKEYKPEVGHSILIISNMMLNFKIKIWRYKEVVKYGQDNKKIAKTCRNPQIIYCCH